MTYLEPVANSYYSENDTYELGMDLIIKILISLGIFATFIILIWVFAKLVGSK